MSGEERRVWVGKNVARERKSHGWTQVELAKRLAAAMGKPFDPATLARLEKGKRSIDVGELVILAEVLRVDARHLLSHPEQREWITTVLDYRASARAALGDIDDAAQRYFRDRHQIAFTEGRVREKYGDDALSRRRDEIGRWDYPDQPAAFEALVVVLKAAGVDEEGAEVVAGEAVDRIEWPPVERSSGYAPLRRGASASGSQ